MAAGAAWRLRGGVLSVSLPAWTKTRMSHAAPSCVCTGTVHGAGLIGRTAAPWPVRCGVWLVWLAVWLRGVAKALRSSHRSTRSRTSEYGVTSLSRDWTRTLVTQLCVVSSLVEILSA